ncbi:right-handed parallel beta-helix repeat-containing protein [Rubellicoccus peritrichatus]|uniref:Fibronectin type-III domain-containing protein n=1 Tax=Rubellicoccus peritrichatus TaxID=3080537 RepID=A0AAQ3L6Q1_9BACT|nr:right-handed parallel beta-helix repeat-containing protein [Puniceicoccus sp. CR14]WOO40076.1 hypothetical protein RZN69_15740 [Puniceicoccus sp. CR14]
MNRRLFKIFAALLLTTLALLAAPNWWITREIAELQPPAPGENGHDPDVYEAWMEDNYSPAIIGQAKHLAKQAYLEMEARSPGSAGPDVEAMVNSFSTDFEDNYQPLLIGQLKAIAKPFYDQINYLADDPSIILAAQTYSGYPWTGEATIDDNYAPANIGQLKLTFNIILEAWPPEISSSLLQVIVDADPFDDITSLEDVDLEQDFDGDGVSNRSEIYAKTDPVDAYNGISPSIHGPLVRYKQGVPGGVSSAFVGSVWDVNDVPIENAPIVIEIVGKNSAAISLNSDASDLASVIVTTAGQGAEAGQFCFYGVFPQEVGDGFKVRVFPVGRPELSEWFTFVSEPDKDYANSGIISWIRADGVATLVTDSDGDNQIEEIFDYSSSENFLSRSGDGNRPELLNGVSNVHNGAKMIEFDGTDYLQWPHEAYVGRTQLEAFIVVEAAEDAASSGGQSLWQLAYFHGSFNNNHSFTRYPDSSGRIAEDAGLTGISGGNDSPYKIYPDYDVTNLNVYHVSNDGNVMRLKLNGRELVVFDVSSENFDISGSLVLGRDRVQERHKSLYSFFRGKIAEVILFDQVQDESTQWEVFDYLQAKYDLTEIPVEPTDFNAFSLGGTSVYLTWLPDQGQSAGVRYEIQRRDVSAGSNYASIEVVNGESWIDDAVALNSIYQYRLRAVSSIGQSSWLESDLISTGDGSSPFPSGKMVAWHASDWLGGISDRVVNWHDRSGNQNHLYSTINNSASVRYSAELSKNTLGFAGPAGETPSSWYKWEADSLATLSEVEAFIVVRAETDLGIIGSDGQPLWSMQRFSSGNYDRTYTRYPDGSGRIVEDIGLTLGGGGDSPYKATPTRSLGLFNVYHCSNDRVNLVQTFNGTQIASHDISGKSFSMDDDKGKELGLGFDRVTGSYSTLVDYFAGDIAELIVCGNVLSEAERQSVFDYFNNKYDGVFPPAEIATPLLTQIGSGQVVISWANGIDNNNATVTIERRLATEPSSSYTLLGELDWNDMRFWDEDLPPGAYVYRIRAQNTAGFVSGYSSEVSIDVINSDEQSWTAEMWSDLVLWLNSGNFVLDDQSIGQWLDISGNGAHATAPSTNSTPAISNINGVESLQFDGVEDSFNLNDPFAGLSATEAELFIVLKRSPDESGPDGLGQWGGGGNSYYPNGDGIIYDNFGAHGHYSMGAPPIDLTEPHLLNVSAKTGLWSARINGRLLFEANNTVFTLPTTYRLGRNAAGNYFEGEIAEVLMFDRNLSDVEREALSDYLIDKYSLMSAPGSIATVSTNAISSEQVMLQWSINDAAYGDSLLIERREVGGSYSRVERIYGSQSYIDDGLMADTDYEYRLTPYAGLVAGASVETSVRTSDMSPIPLTNSFLWLAADRGPVPGQSLRFWQDLSGNFNHASIDTTGYQPLLVNNDEGQSVARFDGSDLIFLPAAAFGMTELADDPEVEAFIVLRTTDSQPSARSALWRMGNDYAPGIYDDPPWTRSVANKINDYAIGRTVRDDFGLEAATTYYSNCAGAGFEATLNHVVSPSELHTYNVSVIAGATWRAYQNGQFITEYDISGRCFDFNDQEIVLGADRGTLANGLGHPATYYFHGDIAEFLVFDKALNDNERATVNAYLARKYEMGVEPEPISGFTADSISSSQVRLSWNGGSWDDDTVEFVIERSTDGVNFAEIGRVDSAREFIDESLTAGATYYYRVHATNFHGATDSVELSITTDDVGVDVPLDAVLWLNASQGVVPNSGGEPGIQNWPNLGAVGTGATQTTAANRPFLADGAIGGQPAVIFDGSTDHFTISNPFDGLSPIEAELFVVLKRGTDDSGPDGLGQWGGGGNSYYPDANGVLYDNFGAHGHYSMGASPIDLTQPHLLNVSAKTGLWSARINGRLHFEANNTVFTLPTTYQLGRNAVGNYFEGEIAEVLMFDRNLSEAEREALSDYLIDKYSLMVEPGSISESSTYAISSEQVMLQWSINDASYGDSMLIERREVGGSYIRIARIHGSQSYIDDGLIPESDYEYRLTPCAGLVAGAAVEGSVSTLGVDSSPIPFDNNFLWLAADRGPAQGNLIRFWEDLSGNYNHAGMGTASHQPQVVNADKGYPVVRFDGGQYISLPSVPFKNLELASSPEAEVFVVLKSNYADNGSGRSSLWRMGGDNYGTGNTPGYPANAVVANYRSSEALRDDFGVNGQSNYGELGFGAHFALGVDLDDWNAYNVSVSQDAWTAYFNGSLEQQYISPPEDPLFEFKFSDYIWLGRDIGNISTANGADAYQSSQYYYFTGDVAEFLVFDRTLSETERATLNAYLATKYQMGVEPEDITDLEVAAISPTQVLLMWSGGSWDEVGTEFVIERSTDGANFIEVGRVANGRSFIDEDLAADANYTYRIFAETPVGQSGIAVITTTTMGTGTAFPLADVVTWHAADFAKPIKGRIQRLRDISGNGNDALQSSISLQPAWVDDQSLVGPVLRFTGGQYLNLNAAGLNDLESVNGGNDEAEVFVVMQPSSIPEGQKNYFWRMGYDSIGGNGTRLNHGGRGVESTIPSKPGTFIDDFAVHSEGYENSGSHYQMKAYVPFGPSVQKLSLYNASVDATRWKAWVNGEEVVEYLRTDYPYEFNFHDSIRLGSDRKSSTFSPTDGFFHGDIAELVIFQKALSDDERRAVEQYFRAKYQIAASAPAVSNLDANGISKNQVSLTWTTAEQTGGYNVVIERKKGDSDWEWVGEVRESSSYLDDGLDVDTFYTYRVRASLDLGGESDYSNEVTAKTLRPEIESLPLGAMRLWLKADSGIINSNAWHWKDQSPYGFSVIAAEGVVAPQQVISGNFPVVSLSGNGEYYILPEEVFEGIDAFEGAELYAVFRSVTSPGSENPLWRLGSAGAFVDGATILDDFASELAAYDSTVLQPPSETFADFQLYQVSAVGGNRITEINAIETLSVNSNLFSMPTSPLLGHNSDAGGPGFYGDFAEIIVFDRTLSPSERRTVSSYLMQKYLEHRNTDADGVFEDYQEVRYGYDPYVGDDAEIDSDMDGLYALEEGFYSTDPTLSDTDGDGANDGLEVALGYDPLVGNPLDDADGDGFPNQWEVWAGTDASLASEYPSEINADVATGVLSAAIDGQRYLLVDPDYTGSYSMVFGTIEEAVAEAATVEESLDIIAIAPRDVAYHESVNIPDGLHMLIVAIPSSDGSRVILDGRTANTSLATGFAFYDNYYAPNSNAIVHGICFQNYTDSALYTSHAPIMVRNCEFRFNNNAITASHSSARFENCLIHHNTGETPAIDNARGVSTFVNCTIVDNVAYLDGQVIASTSYAISGYKRAAALYFKQCIIHNPLSDREIEVRVTGPDNDKRSSWVTLERSMVRGCSSDGNLVSSDLLFHDNHYNYSDRGIISGIIALDHVTPITDPGMTYDGHLLESSTISALSVSIDIDEDYTRRDFDGEPRLAGSAIHIGADQYIDVDGVNDGDGIPDYYEALAVSEDSDGLTLAQEYAASTHPNRADTDGDSVSDDFEDSRHLNPLKIEYWVDADRDRIPNWFEAVLSTNGGDASDVPPADWTVGPGLTSAANSESESLQEALTGLEDAEGVIPEYTIIRLVGNPNDSGKVTLNNLGRVLIYSGDGDSVFSNSNSAAMSIIDGSPIINGLVFENSKPGLEVSGGNPRIERCVFRYNQHGLTTGGYSKAIFVNCEFYRNYAENGGAVSTGGDSAPRFYSCFFYENTAYNEGGAVSGGFSSPSFYNCTFADNRAANGGHAFRNHFGDNPLHQYHRPISAYNSIIWNHSEGGEVAGWHTDYIHFYNCLVRTPNGSANYYLDGKSAGPVKDDPEFASPLYPDPDGSGMIARQYRLSADSVAAIKKGYFRYGYANFDLDGDPCDPMNMDIGADAFVDIDNDDLADAWEFAHFDDGANTLLNQGGDSHKFDPDNLVDVDGPDDDGISLRDEYKLGLDPYVWNGVQEIQPVSRSLAVSGSTAEAPQIQFKVFKDGSTVKADFFGVVYEDLDSNGIFDSISFHSLGSQVSGNFSPDDSSNSYLPQIHQLKGLDGDLDGNFDDALDRYEVIAVKITTVNPTGPDDVFDPTTEINPEGIDLALDFSALRYLRYYRNEWFTITAGADGMEPLLIHNVVYPEMFEGTKESLPSGLLKGRILDQRETFGWIPIVASGSFVTEAGMNGANEQPNVEGNYHVYSLPENSFYFASAHVNNFRIDGYETRPSSGAVAQAQFELTGEADVTLTAYAPNDLSAPIALHEVEGARAEISSSREGTAGATELINIPFRLSDYDGVQDHLFDSDDMGSSASRDYFRIKLTITDPFTGRTETRWATLKADL